MQDSNEDDMDVEMAGTTTENHHLEAAANKQQYLQAEHISGQDVNDWIDLPELPKRQPVKVQTVANIYRSAFTILLERWGCYPASCLPEELQKVTPYSLGLTSRLAELALSTPGCRDKVHAILANIRRERFAFLMETHPEFEPWTIIPTGLYRDMPFKRLTEHRIHEYAGGLTISDVEEAKVRCKNLVMPREQQLEAKAEERASRAAKRNNRSGSGLVADEQHGLRLETHLGAGVWEGAGRQNNKNRQARANNAGSKRERKRRAREAVLGVNSGQRAGRQELNSSTAAVAGDETGDAAVGDWTMDSTFAPPNSPQEGNSANQTPTPSRKERKGKKKVDRFMSRIFDGISIQQDDLTPQHNRPSVHKQKLPAVLKQGSPQTSDDTILPLERSAMHSAPLSFRPKATNPPPDNEEL